MTDRVLSGAAALLRFLVQAGRLTPEQAAQAQEAITDQTVPATVHEWLAGSGIISEEDLARLLSERLHLPYVNLAGQSIDPSVTALVKEELATRCQCLPLSAPNGTLVIATANPLDRDALRAIEFATGKRVRPEIASITSVLDGLKHAYHLDESLDQYLQGVQSDGEVKVSELEDESQDLSNLLRSTQLPPVVKLFNLIVLEGIRAGASDVHIEPTGPMVLVRYRIDGMLEESFKLPKWVHAPLTARCMVLAKLDITEHRVPQDGRIRIRYRESMIDLRVSSLPTQFGEKLTLRILNPSTAPTGLAQLQLSERDLACIRRAIHRPEGIVLVTGPTGSGKSTTLYAMIAELVSPTRNIVTIENPIEYQLRGVNQVEINEKQRLTFAATLRSVLRQDPDVILVGEIRDAETAQTALRAAQTGHLVLSTLHTNDSVSTVTRLLDLGIEPYVLASSLNLIVAQRLIRCTCEQCAAPYEPEPEMLRALQLVGPKHRFRKGPGCSRCRDSGYSGRVAVFEVMSFTARMAKLIESKVPESALRLQARDDGMHLLAEQAAEKVSDGVTTAEEVLRAIDVIDGGERCPSCDRAVDNTFAVCPHCATPLRLQCRNCNMQLQKDWQTCPYCGMAVKQVQPPSAPLTPPMSAPVTGTAGPTAGAAPTAAVPRSFCALVVDDQPDMRLLITRTLERSGLPLLTIMASNGAEGLQRAHEDKPDLIVLDVMMPEMDGFEVCQRLRADVRTTFIPILMLTALDDSNHRAKGFMAGTDDYIGKPFDRVELVARVRRLIERSYGAVLPGNAAPREETSATRTASDAEAARA